MNKGKLYTSYFAKLNKGIGVKISIARYNPKWLKKGDINFWFQSLSPSKELLYDYKYNNLLWEDYEKRYRDEVGGHVLHGDMRALLNLLNSGRDVTVYCYEKSTDNCHRHILGDIIRGLGYEVKEIE